MTDGPEGLPPLAATVTADELPQLFEEFSRATSELVAAHDALLAEAEELRREIAVKDRRLERKKRLEAIGRVAAGVAHEFRNPLGGIRLRVDRLLADPDAPEPTRERLQQILAAVTHLDRIVEDLLTYTRAGEIVRQARAVAALVQHARQLAFPDPDLHDLEIITGGPADLAIRVDPEAFCQVLVNLLANASQATQDRPDAAIGIWWGRAADGVWIEVADNGPGIPVGEEERIFHPFHTLREGGTGLGLAIAHSRVEAHEGELVLVGSDPRGGHPGWAGARFRILLPGEESSA